MSEKKELLYVATLKKMHDQLSDVIEETRQRTDLSLSTKQQAISFMIHQLDTLGFAVQELTRAYGKPPTVIETTARVIDIDGRRPTGINPTDLPDTTG